MADPAPDFEVHDDDEGFVLLEQYALARHDWETTALPLKRANTELKEQDKLVQSWRMIVERVQDVDNVEEVDWNDPDELGYATAEGMLEYASVQLEAAEPELQRRSVAARGARRQRKAAKTAMVEAETALNTYWVATWQVDGVARTVVTFNSDGMKTVSRTHTESDTFKLAGE